MEKYDLAQKALLELLDNDPGNPGTHYNLACVYSLLKQKENAIDHLIVATYLDPSCRMDIEEEESFANIRNSEEFKKIPL